MGRSHSGGEKGERRTVEVKKEAHRPRREPPCTPPQFCSASEQGRNTPAHGDSSLVPRTLSCFQRKRTHWNPSGSLTAYRFLLASL